MKYTLQLDWYVMLLNYDRVGEVYVGCYVWRTLFWDRQEVQHRFVNQRLFDKCICNFCLFRNPYLDDRGCLNLRKNRSNLLLEHSRFWLYRLGYVSHKSWSKFFLEDSFLLPSTALPRCGSFVDTFLCDSLGRMYKLGLLFGSIIQTKSKRSELGIHAHWCG